MENEINPSEQAPQKDAAYYHNKALSLIAQGYSTQEVKNLLMNDGLNEESTDFLINELSNIQAGSNDLEREKGRKNMIYGALWCVGGIIITAVSYSAAKGGGRYFITYGAIIVGAIQFFKGLSQYNKGN